MKKKGTKENPRGIMFTKVVTWEHTCDCYKKDNRDVLDSGFFSLTRRS